MLIIVSISLLFIADIYYLVGLYGSIREEAGRMVHTCIADADDEELQLRMQRLSSLSTEPHEISIRKSSHSDSTSQATEAIVLEQLVGEIRTTLHHTLDSLLPANPMQLDSLISAHFHRKGISAQLYYVEVADRDGSTAVATSRTEYGQQIRTPFVYTYAPSGSYTYIIYMESLTGVVLGRMSGILVSTFLILILLGIAFRYFIRTVISLKSLEEMKSDFTNNMTHELKTPITVAYSAIDTLLHYKQGDNKEKREQYLSICLEQLSHLLNLVEKILSMSRESPSPQKGIDCTDVELEPLVRQIANNHLLGKEQEVVIDIDLGTPSPVVYADASLLHSMVNNLVDNAIKYSPSPARIGIRYGVEPGGYWLSVKDNGCGVSRENQKYLFDQFYRVPQGNRHNVKGYGLGLYHVKRMAEQHGGTITLQSSPNKGSEFTLRLPLRR